MCGSFLLDALTPPFSFLHAVAFSIFLFDDYLPFPDASPPFSSLNVPIGDYLALRHSFRFADSFVLC